MISEENKIILIKRFKSLLWRAGSFAAIAGLSFIASNAQLFELPPLAIVIIALVTGELTKQLNSSK